MFGALSVKPTQILSNSPAVSDLQLRCNPCSRDLVLTGKNPDGTFRASQAQEYPPALCKALALMVFKDPAGLRGSLAVQGPNGEIREPPGLEKHLAGDAVRRKQRGDVPGTRFCGGGQISTLEMETDPYHEYRGRRHPYQSEGITRLEVRPQASSQTWTQKVWTASHLLK